MTAQLIENMPSEEYHALKRFNASGSKKLAVSAQDFWVSSWMNPDKYESEKEVFNLGTAYHVRILEGSQSFTQRYAPDFDKSAHPQALVTVADIKSAIETIGAKATGKVKADHIAQLLYLDPDAKILDDMTERHAALNAGRELLPPRVFRQINAAGDRIESTPEIYKYLEGSKTEVTILWEDKETGVPMKARMDRRREDLILDLKTFSNPSDIPIGKLTAMHIAKYKYHVQMAVYREAERALTGNAIDAAFIFQQTGDANNCLVRRFPETLLLAQQGRDIMCAGINKFRDMYQKFGESPWFDEVDDSPCRDEDFPMYVFE